MTPGGWQPMVGNPRVGNNPWLGIRCGEAVGIAVVSEPPATEPATEPPATDLYAARGGPVEHRILPDAGTAPKHLSHIARRRHSSQEFVPIWPSGPGFRKIRESSDLWTATAKTATAKSHVPLRRA